MYYQDRALYYNLSACSIRAYTLYLLNKSQCSLTCFVYKVLVYSKKLRFFFYNFSLLSKSKVGESYENHLVILSANELKIMTNDIP